MQQIFVGDIQGCADELGEILARAKLHFGMRFSLWVVGDVVNRGPHSLRALRAVRELVEAGRGRLVLGNHEVALLQTALGARRLVEGDTFTDVLDAPDVSDWIDWLRARPLVEVGRLGAQHFAMVHAAVHPDWSLAELEERAAGVALQLRGSPDTTRALLAPEARGDVRDALERLTNCRSVAGGNWSALLPEGESVAWHSEWSKRAHGYGVVYGHWALQGLHVAPLLRGLDTGCVHHGRSGDRALTAWLPDPGSETPFDVPDESFWRVAARRIYRAT